MWKIDRLMKRQEIYYIHKSVSHFLQLHVKSTHLLFVHVSFATRIYGIIGNIVVIKVRERNYNCMNIRLSTIEPR